MSEHQIPQVSGTATEQPAPAAEACPACGTVEFRVLVVAGDRRYCTTSRQFQVVECHGCRLIRMEPKPLPEELRQYYPAASPSRRAPELSVRALIERFAYRPQLRFTERAIAESGDSGTVLDVGCGDGRFLGHLKRRGVQNLAGLDFSLDTAAEAWRVHDVPVVCGTLSRAPFASGSCAVVSMFQVLQHLYDPIVFLDAARDLLAPEGRLILQVPNAACWQFLIFGERWSGLDIPRQLILFKASDIEGLLVESGFEVLRRQHFCLHDNTAMLVNSMFPGLDPDSREVRGIRETRAARFWKSAAYYTLFAVSLPFAIFEGGCHAGSTVMFEARKRR